MRSSDHVFLFRHCMRSTESVYRLHTGNGQDEAFATRFAPEWHTPLYWCTEAGMRQMTTTGEHIFQKVYHELIESIEAANSDGSNDASPPPQIRVRFLVDHLSQRDVDTALALSQGMQNMALMLSSSTNSTENGSGSSSSHNSSHRIQVTGLDRLDFAAHIFDPFRADIFPPQPDIPATRTALCQDETLAQMTVDQIQAQTQARLDSVPPPTVLSLESAAQLWIHAGLVNASMDTTTVAPSVVVDTTKRDAVLTGPINYVKLGTQMLFYARASNLEFPSVQGRTPVNITNDELYALLQWHYWMRSVLDVGTRSAAVTGAALARTVHDALSTSDPRSVTTLTLLVGHDGNLNALATSWGITWALEAPYATLNAWVATPPGSAIAVTRRTNRNDATTADTLALSYLYPVYSLNQSASIDIRHVPIQLETWAGGPPVLPHHVVNHATVVDWNEWTSRVASRLERYPGATACYEASGGAVGSAVSPPMTSLSPWYPRSLVASTCGNVILVLLLLRQWFQRRRRSTNNASNQNYNVVSNAPVVNGDLT